MTLPLQWTDQGLLYMQVRQATNGDIFFLDASGESSTILATVAPTPSAQISPNGKWMVYSEWEAEQPALFVQAFPDGNLRWPVTTKTGSHAKWSADGAWLFYVSYNQIMSVSVTERDDKLSFGKPELVYEFSGFGDIAFDPFDISPDGKSMVVIDQIDSNPPSQVYVSHWKDMLPDTQPARNDLVTSEPK